jgi:hypothetical protein
MPQVKWIRDSPLSYQTAVQLWAKADPKVGVSMGWGGLKLFERGRAATNLPPVYRVKKGCIVLGDIHPDHVALLPGAWRSDLSFEFLERFSPVPIRQDGPDWFLIRHGQGLIPVLFLDGMSVQTDPPKILGPIVPWTPADKKPPSRAAQSFFEEYVEYICEWATNHQIEHPSAEGCWDCYFFTTPFIEGARLPHGAEPEGVRHLYEHALKRAIEPSLIWRAIRERGLNPEHNWSKVVGTVDRPANTTLLRDYMRAFFRRRAGSLGAYQLWVTTREKPNDDGSSAGNPS